MSELKKFKHYQKCDVNNGEESFAQRTSDVPPVESERRAADLLYEHQLVLLRRPDWMTGANQRAHKHQEGHQPEGRRRGGEPHRSARCPPGTVCSVSEGGRTLNKL